MVVGFEEVLHLPYLSSLFQYHHFQNKDSNQRGFHDSALSTPDTFPNPKGMDKPVGYS